RMRTELQPDGVFLWVDGLPGGRRIEAHERLGHGEVVTGRIGAKDAAGPSVARGALIHHWVGTVFIPGVSLQQVLTLLQDYDHHSIYFSPEVSRSRTLEHAGDDFKV